MGSDSVEGGRRPLSDSLDQAGTPGTPLQGRRRSLKSRESARTCWCAWKGDFPSYTPGTPNRRNGLDPRRERLCTIGASLI